MSSSRLSVRKVKRILHRIGDSVAPPGSPFSSSPYPVSIWRRDLEAEKVPPEGGPETFDQPEALAINRARISHLISLGLPLAGKQVLDVGCGVGHLAASLVRQGCRVVCVDARQQNVASLRSRYPDLEAYVADLEREPLSRFGVFDIVFSYGVLYHLENPLAALRNMESVCRELFLLETLVCDHRLPILLLADESREFSQALAGVGCRPSPSYVVAALNRAGFRHVYAPRVPPDHPDFRFEWKNNLEWQRDEHLLRCVFLASKTEIHNPNLVALLRD